MGRVLFALPLIGSVIGGAVLILTLVGAQGAPQEAAGAAIAVALAVLPYVLCRSIQLMRQESRASATDRLIDAVRTSASQHHYQVTRPATDLSKIEPLAPHREP